jgi:hypothetical protein
MSLSLTYNFKVTPSGVAASKLPLMANVAELLPAGIVTEEDVKS